ncbi:MAG: site-specific integrase, partial [Acidobacteriota bacterium]|nr:site-specific integrase [Acidobacteriota bacterium]
KRHDLMRRADDRKDAKRVIRELLDGLEERGERSLEADRLTFAQVANRYRNEKAIEPVYQGTRKISGMRSWYTTRIYITVLEEHFGNKRLKDIRPVDLEGFKRKRLATPTKAGKGERTIAAVHRELEVLRAVLRWAVRHGWLQRSPFENGETIISKADENRRDRVLSADEELRLLAVCGADSPRAHLRPILVCALDAAMRRGEILKLIWSDVHLDAGMIVLRSETTKTARGRIVPITSRLKAELEGLRDAANGAVSNNGRVFGIVNDVKRSFGTACRLAGIADLHLHDLRHTATTRLVSAGINPALAMKITGHDQASTFQRYLNPQAEQMRDVAEKLSRHLSGQGGGKGQGEGQGDGSIH